MRSALTHWRGPSVRGVRSPATPLWLRANCRHSHTESVFQIQATGLEPHPWQQLSQAVLAPARALRPPFPCRWAAPASNFKGPRWDGPPRSPEVGMCSGWLRAVSHLDAVGPQGPPWGLRCPSACKPGACRSRPDNGEAQSRLAAQPECEGRSPRFGPVPLPALLPLGGLGCGGAAHRATSGVAGQRGASCGFVISPSYV